MISLSFLPFSLKPKGNLMEREFLLVVALCLSLSNYAFEASGDASSCKNCSKCEYPCQQPSDPTLLYEAPPPLPPSPPPSGYSIYAAPPPPQEKGYNAMCPPAPYTFALPNPYTYVPYSEGRGSASTLWPVLVQLIILFSYFLFLF